MGRSSGKTGTGKRNNPNIDKIGVLGNRIRTAAVDHRIWEFVCDTMPLDTPFSVAEVAGLPGALAVYGGSRATRMLRFEVALRRIPATSKDLIIWEPWDDYHQWYLPSVKE